MDNHKFDEIFSQKLKETQEFKFEESDWEFVAAQIPQAKERKKRGFGFWFFPFALLLLGSSCMYLFFTLHKTNKELGLMKEQVSAISKDNIIDKTETETLPTPIISTPMAPLLSPKQLLLTVIKLAKKELSVKISILSIAVQPIESVAIIV